MGCCKSAAADDPGAAQPLAHAPQELAPAHAPQELAAEPKDPVGELPPELPPRAKLPELPSVEDLIAEGVEANRRALLAFEGWDYSLRVAGCKGADSSKLPRAGLEAWFKAESYDVGNKTWPSLINKYVARVTAGQMTFLEEEGHGANIKVKAVQGDPATVCDFGHVIKGAFTCASVCRYLPGAHARILQGGRSNWLHSHWGNQTGVAHYDGWKTPHQRNTGSEDWVVFIGQNGGEEIKRANGHNVSTANGGSGDQQLMINAGKHGGEKSNFAVLEVMSWNRHLPLAEITEVEKYLQRRLGQRLSVEAEQVLTEVAGAGFAIRRLHQIGQRVEPAAIKVKDEIVKDYLSSKANFVKMCHEQESYSVEKAEATLKDSEAKLWANMIEELVATGKTEEAAQSESVPLKVLEKAAVDATLVRKIVIPRDLPVEMDQLQLLHGDADRIPCLACQNQDPATADVVAHGALQPVLVRGASEPLPTMSRRYREKVDVIRGASQCQLIRGISAMAKRPDVCESNSKMLKGGVDGVLWLFETKGGGWDTYRPHMARILEQAFHDGPGALVQVKGGRFDYLVDITHMTQRNAETGTERRLLRVIPSPDGGIEIPPPLAETVCRRVSCKYGSKCFRRNRDHKVQFAHPGDPDYVDVEADAPDEPAWFWQTEGGDANPIDRAMSRQLESLRTSRLASLGIIIQVPSVSERLQVNLEYMTARGESGAEYLLTRVSPFHDEEEVMDNSVPEEPIVEESLPKQPSISESKLPDVQHGDDLEDPADPEDPGDLEEPENLGKAKTRKTRKSQRRRKSKPRKSLGSEDPGKTLDSEEPGKIHDSEEPEKTLDSKDPAKTQDLEDPVKSEDPEDRPEDPVLFRVKSEPAVSRGLDAKADVVQAARELPAALEAHVTTNPMCQVCSGTGYMSKYLSEGDVAIAVEMRSADQLEGYDCSICYGEGQYALSACCGKHFYCSDCIESSLDAILASGQFPAMCPMCRAEAMGAPDVAACGIGEAELSFLQACDVISSELLFRFLRQMRQSDETRGEEKYFACPAKCGRFLLEADPSYYDELGSLFSLGFWRGDKFVGSDKQLVRLGACACGSYVCVRCNQAVTLPASHECPEFKGADDSLEAIEPLLKASIAKRCPNCPALIIKNEGCNFMTCTACKDPRGFCWQTGKPRHGPCPPCCGGGHNCH